MGNPSFRRPTHEERLRKINRDLAELVEEKRALEAELKVKQPEVEK
jgi:hypothetical protein